MKIGIITIQKCNNFGADLQAFALQKKLQLLGYDAENIGYLFYKHLEHRRSRASKPSFKLSAVNRAKEWFSPKINALKGLMRRADEAERWAKFADFFSKNVKSSKPYRTIDALYADPPKYDVYVTGSDQAWNPRKGALIEPYFSGMRFRAEIKVSFGALLELRPFGNFESLKDVEELCVWSAKKGAYILLGESFACFADKPYAHHMRGFLVKCLALSMMKSISKSCVVSSVSQLRTKLNSIDCLMSKLSVARASNLHLGCRFHIAQLPRRYRRYASDSIARVRRYSFNPDNRLAYPNVRCSNDRRS